jgi:glyoxalase family protein
MTEERETPPTPWDRSPVPTSRQIRGLGPIVISVPTLSPTDMLLTEVLNMRASGDYPHPENPTTRVHVFAMGAGGAPAELHVAVQPDLAVAQQGKPAEFIMSPSGPRMRTTMHGRRG